METSTSHVQAIEHPAPHALRQQRIADHLGIDLRAQLTDDSERAVPADLLHGVVQDNHTTSRQGLSGLVLVRGSHRERRREGRQTTRWGNLLEEDVRQVVRLSQGQQSPHKLLGHRVFIHKSNRTGVHAPFGSDAPPTFMSISSGYACLVAVDVAPVITGRGGCAG